MCNEECILITSVHDSAALTFTGLLSLYDECLGGTGKAFLLRSFNASP